MIELIIDDYILFSANLFINLKILYVFYVFVY